jgi:lipopolysaccharide export system protein LptC
MVNALRSAVEQNSSMLGDNPNRDKLPLYKSGYSSFVRLAKYFLPLVAGIVILLLAVWPELKSYPEKFSLGLSDFKVETAGGQRVINARFTGVDSENRPFLITAESVAQAISSKDGVQLLKPKADVTLAGDSWVAIAAPAGLFRRTDENLYLTGGVDLYHDGGYEFRTAEAKLDFRKSSATGSAPVYGQGPFGTIEAEGFQILGTGDSIHFKGKSRLLLYLDTPSVKAAE